MKKSTTITLVAILAIGMMIPQTLAATSQGFFYRINDGDRFYYTMQFEEEGSIELSEIIYIEIENASKPIPDPVTHLDNFSHPDIVMNFENGTSLGLMAILFMYAYYLDYPVGNWELINTLAATDLEDILFVGFDELSLSLTDDLWSVLYVMEDVDSEIRVTIDYSTFDGMMHNYRIDQVNTTSDELMFRYDVTRYTEHNLEWGVSDGNTFDYNVVITGQIGTLEPIDEYVYIEIAEEGLPVIPYSLIDLADIPNIDSETYWANDTLPSVDYFDIVIRQALPVGNWTLMDDLIDAVGIPGGVTMDDPDPYFWGFSWEIDIGDFIQEVHTDYLKTDGMVARHTVTISNSSTLEWMGTISLERTDLLPYTDRTAPVINHPSDIEFVEGAGNQSIVWGLIDENPTTYEVSVNGTVVGSGSWTSGDAITLDVSNFETGEYVCIITAYDIAGNAAMDTVQVTVTSSGGGIPDIITDNLLYIAIGAGAIILIGAIVVLRRR